MRADFSEHPEAIRQFADDFLAVPQQRLLADGVAYSRQQQLGKDHGWLERRECWVVAGPDGLAYVDPKRQRARLGSVSRVSYRRDAAAGSPTDARYCICGPSPPTSPSFPYFLNEKYLDSPSPF